MFEHGYYNRFSKLQDVLNSIESLQTLVTWSEVADKELHKILWEIVGSEKLQLNILPSGLKRKEVEDKKLTFDPLYPKDADNLIVKVELPIGDSPISHIAFGFTAVKDYFSNPNIEIGIDTQDYDYEMTEKAWTQKSFLSLLESPIHSLRLSHVTSEMLAFLFPTKNDEQHPYWKNLTSLTIHGFNKEDVKLFVQSPCLKKVMDLSLFGTLDDDSIKLISESVYLKNLIRLNLGFNGITDKGAEYLANTKLKELFLNFNGITDEGAKVLANNKTITLLNLDDNNLTTEGEKVVKEMLERNEKIN